MKRGSRPEWSSEAVARLGAGETLRAVSERFGVTTHAVRWAIEGCAEEEDAARRRVVRATPGKDHIVPPAPLVTPLFIHPVAAPRPVERTMDRDPKLDLFVRHLYRTPRDLIRRHAVLPTARLFASGKITREQLMARIDMPQPVVLDDPDGEGLS